MDAIKTFPALLSLKPFNSDRCYVFTRTTYFCSKLNNVDMWNKTSVFSMIQKTSVSLTVHVDEYIYTVLLSK